MTMNLENPSPRFRPYHNPDHIDESCVPPGWRFRYADEANSLAYPCRLLNYGTGEWPLSKYCGGLIHTTYIVPVAGL